MSQRDFLQSQMLRLFSKLFLIFTIALPLYTFAFTVPTRPTGFVQDYAKILTTEQVNTLESKLETFEKQTTNEIAIVTVPSLDNEPIENVAQEIFTKWGIGKKDKNNGVLLLVSLADRKTRIQTGYGVEGDLTDIATSYIQSDIITPAFRAGDYNAGINGAVDKIIETLGGNQIVPKDYEQSNNNSRGFNWNFIFIFGFIVLQWLIAILARSKSWWGGGIIGGVIALALWHFFIFSLIFVIPLFVILVGFGLLLDFFASRAYQKHKSTGMRPPWFLGGGGFGGRGGGGFGGFGGGGSGGGGSSGSW